MNQCLQTLLGFAVFVVACGQVGGVPAPKDPPANLIINGSFEDGPEVANWKPIDKDSTAIKGWTVTRGQIDFIGTLWQHADGKRSLDLHGSPGYGGIKQTIPTIKDRKYRVTFSLAATPTKGQRGVVVRAGERSATFEFDGSKTTYEDMGWVKKSMEFTATGPATVIEFHTDGTGDNLCGPALDDVSVIDIGK